MRKYSWRIKLKKKEKSYSIISIGGGLHYELTLAKKFSSKPY